MFFWGGVDDRRIVAWKYKYIAHAASPFQCELLAMDQALAELVAVVGQ